MVPKTEEEEGEEEEQDGGDKLMILSMSIRFQ
jgi:hypothetical protein